MFNGMTRTLKAAALPVSLPEPTAALTIRRKGFDWYLSVAQKQGMMHKLTVSDGCRMLQLGGVVFVCFT